MISSGPESLFISAHISPNHQLHNQGRELNSHFTNQSHCPRHIPLMATINHDHIINPTQRHIRVTFHPIICPHFSKTGPNLHL